jgi:hypothetical protein
MSGDFESVHNVHEQAVFRAVLDALPDYPKLSPEIVADVACVALNKLPPRYIRHAADHAFFLTEAERNANDAAIAEAVNAGFQFVLARNAMLARR